MHYYGDFYKLNDTRCRSTLEIVRSEEENPNILLCKSPDVIVVMMNPGNTCPRNTRSKSGSGGFLRVQTFAEIGNNPNLVCVRPENTQDAIVKLMDCKRFEHVRVLNLSDARLRPKENVVVAGWGYYRELDCLSHMAYTHNRVT